MLFRQLFPHNRRGGQNDPSPRVTCLLSQSRTFRGRFPKLCDLIYSHVRPHALSRESFSAFQVWGQLPIKRVRNFHQQCVEFATCTAFEPALAVLRGLERVGTYVVPGDESAALDGKRAEIIPFA
jgi:hypothetical protein